MCQKLVSTLGPVFFGIKHHSYSRPIKYISVFPTYPASHKHTNTNNRIVAEKNISKIILEQIKYFLAFEVWRVFFELKLCWHALVTAYSHICMTFFLGHPFFKVYFFLSAIALIDSKDALVSTFLVLQNSSGQEYWMSWTQLGQKWWLVNSTLFNIWFQSAWLLTFVGQSHVSCHICMLQLTRGKNMCEYITFYMYCSSGKCELWRPRNSTFNFMF